ncbi:MAG: terminase family protein [Verrucomicrobiales bacterium]|jgi:phage FluMu gp28-like protein|nr:terminase family protein [Verrucomicrobiales bacterium]
MSKPLFKTGLDTLKPYQRAFIADESRFKIWNASRQVGKSYAAACEVVRDCFLTPGTLWVILSAGERQALEFMEKVKIWVKLIDWAIKQEMVERDGPEAILKSAEIRLPNESRVIALPANADTARGYSANLVLDEFAFHKDSSGIWRAIYPSITNPLKRELKVRVLSTPNGQGNKFYEIWSDDGGKWSKHRTTIHDAVAAGLTVDVEELRKQAGDSDTWRQEFECEFIDSSRVAFSYEMLAKCEDAAATLTIENRQLKIENSLYLGIDVGSVSDPTAAVTLEKVGGRLVFRDRLKLQGMALSDQDAVLEPLIRRAVKVSVDASGIGLDLAQRLVRKHGGKVTSQPTTAKWKREAFSRLQNLFNDRALLIPASRELREDFHAYTVSGAGETASFHAPRTDEGHSDLTSATAHAADAAKSGGTVFMPRGFRLGRALDGRRSVE